MRDDFKREPLSGPDKSFASRARIALFLVVIALIRPASGFAQVPPRFYLDNLVGTNAVPLIIQAVDSNVNPLDPAHVVSGSADFEALVAIGGYAKQFALFDRSAFLAVLLPMGGISGETTIAGRDFDQSASGFGDPMVEFNLNVIGPKAMRTIPDLMRYEPGFSLDIITDLAFPIGEYDNDEALNLGQNRWYGRIGAPAILQIGPWVPGRRTTLELLPSVWFFSKNDDYVGTDLETDPMFQLEGHVTRDFMDEFWGSVDVSWLLGGKSEIDGIDGDSLNSVSLGFTLGYHLNDNVQLTAGYKSTIDDDGPNDVETSTFVFSLVVGWHGIVEGMERLEDAE